MGSVSTGLAASAGAERRRSDDVDDDDYSEREYGRAQFGSTGIGSIETGRRHSNSVQLSFVRIQIQRFADCSTMATTRRLHFTPCEQFWRMTTVIVRSPEGVYAFPPRFSILSGIYSKYFSYDSTRALRRS
uniref:Uncharacterized protein n=1 Tax=Kalanchoe fedtschenkoi TaxID=63787 RepID=A0A7N0TWP2_KALFE